MTDESQTEPNPRASAPIHIPKLYRKRPAEAYASEAYFFIFWWYRAFLWLAILGAVLVVGGFIGLIVWRQPPIVNVITAGMLISTVGAMLALMAPLMKPMQGVLEPEQSESR